MFRPPHPPWFNHPNNIRWRIQAVKFIITQFSPRSVFLPFRSFPIYFIKHVEFETLQLLYKMALIMILCLSLFNWTHLPIHEPLIYMDWAPEVSLSHGSIKTVIRKKSCGCITARHNLNFPQQHITIYSSVTSWLQIH
jgi:hypothetical protein